jgi:hypothetical protein
MWAYGFCGKFSLESFQRNPFRDHGQAKSALLESRVYRHMNESDLTLTIARMNNELASAVRQAIAPYAEALREFEASRSKIAEQLETRHLAFETLGGHLQNFFATDRELGKSHRAAVIRLAEAGWTAPDWMSLPDIMALSKQSVAEIDSAITAAL